MPIVAPSIVLLAITAPSNENSDQIAHSPSRVQILPAIWMLEAELPRIAENAHLSMRLPRTSTLPARNTLMPLP